MAVWRATMLSSFEGLFGSSYKDCCLQDVPKLAQSATWVIMPGYLAPGSLLNVSIAGL